MLSEEIYLGSKHIDTYMIGQDTLKKNLVFYFSCGIFNHETNFLIVGPSGSRKKSYYDTIASFENLGQKLRLFQPDTEWF